MNTHKVQQNNEVGVQGVVPQMPNSNWFNRANEAHGQIGLTALFLRPDGLGGGEPRYLYLEIRSCYVDEMASLVSIAEADGWQLDGIPFGTTGHWADCQQEHEEAA